MKKLRVARTIFYIFAGLISATFGSAVSSLLISILKDYIPEMAKFHADFILLPSVASCLAASMVLVEIFFSQPKRLKANRKIFLPYFFGALILGLLTGVLCAVATWILSMYQAQIEPHQVRIIGWSLIGFFTGLGESLIWRIRSIEGGDQQKVFKRIALSNAFGFIAGLLAAILVEVIRNNLITNKSDEDTIGFLLLGFIIGLLFSLSTAPTYQWALRAGQGFEPPGKHDPHPQSERPKIKSSSLRLVFRPNLADKTIIEEGLCIQLPAHTKKPLVIGSKEDADIYIPLIPSECAKLEITNGQVSITCLKSGAIEIEQTPLDTNCPRPLKHNEILTFYYEDKNDEETDLYRFVLYDRFLDPQS